MAPAWARVAAAARGRWCAVRAQYEREMYRRKPLFLFFDESGTFDWQSADAPLYHFGVLTTYRPALLERGLAPIRYKVFGARGVTHLHATNDRQATRDRVFRCLRRQGGFEFDAITVHKPHLSAAIREPSIFYPHFATLLLDRVFARHPSQEGRVVCVTDTLPVARQRKAVEKALKQYMVAQRGSRPYTIVHGPSVGYSGLQAADYCTWAVHKLRLHGDERPYVEISPFVRCVEYVDEGGSVLDGTPTLLQRAAR